VATADESCTLNFGFVQSAIVLNIPARALADAALGSSDSGRLPT